MVNLSQKQLCIIGGVGICIFVVIGYYFYTKLVQDNGEAFEQNNTSFVQEALKQEIEQELIVVHMAGEVKNPGIVRIKEGARIADIIEAAGGLKEEADITNVNLAYVVEDGQKIIIPNKLEQIKSNEEEYISKGTGDTVIQENKQKTETGGKIMININKAEQSELEQLPGIGPSTAIKIIEYRKQNGNFNSIEDIKNVPGIGDAKFENIKDSINVK